MAKELKYLIYVNEELQAVSDGAYEIWSEEEREKYILEP